MKAAHQAYLSEQCDIGKELAEQFEFGNRFGL
jgi:hypothetical protein